ncbi:MAG: DNA polymerase III subunit delta [Candidatus Brocadiae bacterium]|nr:DNA polymerase III subunit delta [Candidatus Brocadiia bacterium]
MARRAPEPDYQDLATHLADDEPLPVYGITGEEPFARGQAIAALRKAILKDTPPDMALSQYSGNDIPSPAELFDELRTRSFLAPLRLVVLEDTAQWLSRSAEALVGYLDKPSKAGVLALVAKSLPRNTRLGKAVRKVGMAIACQAPRDRDLPGWIAFRARAHDKRLDGRAANRLAECVGVNLPVLDQTLAKLALYIGDRDAITEADVDALVEDLPVTTIFRLTDAVGTRDPAKALRVLDNLLEQNNEPNYIISMVRWAMERLINARTLLDAGAPQGKIAKTLRMSQGYFLDQLLRQAGQRSRAELLRGFDLLVDADIDTKTSARPPRDTLEHLLLRLCG